MHEQRSEGSKFKKGLNVVVYYTCKSSHLICCQLDAYFVFHNIHRKNYVLLNIYRYFCRTLVE